MDIPAWYWWLLVVLMVVALCCTLRWFVSSSNAAHTKDGESHMNSHGVEHWIIERLRLGNETEFLKGLKDGFGVSEVAAFKAPMPANAIRVIVVRHGMGHHNDLHGVHSVTNRDADLNHVGHKEATLMGKMLREFGILKPDASISSSSNSGSSASDSKSYGSTAAVVEQDKRPLVKKKKNKEKDILLVVSPFRRTIHTAINMMVCATWSLPTVIEPCK